MKKLWVLLFLVGGLAVGGLGQDEVELVLENGIDDYAGTKDTTIYSESSNANGAGQHLFAGFTARGNERRALLAFDLSALPEGAQITSVTLQLTVSRTQAGASGLSLHRLTADWGEGEEDSPGQEGSGTAAKDNSATWRSNFHNASDWQTPGGDFEATASAQATALGVGSTVTFEGAGLVADVQAWLDGESDNFGWILIADANDTAKRFHASDGNAAEGKKPRLTLRYTTAP